MNRSSAGFAIGLLAWFSGSFATAIAHYSVDAWGFGYFFTTVSAFAIGILVSEMQL